MKTVIEKICERHVDALWEIEKECFSEPWSRNALLDVISNQYAVYLVAVCDGVVAGYVGMYTSFEVGAINNIAVSEKFRRRGVAKQLLCALIEHSRKSGMTTLTLEVRMSNLAAISLYESFGFTLCGQRRGFYKKPLEDALIYNLEL